MTRGYEKFISGLRFIYRNALFNGADMALLETEVG
jgi:hypothetical protein